jgi:hypothetical protein
MPFSALDSLVIPDGATIIIEQPSFYSSERSFTPVRAIAYFKDEKGCHICTSHRRGNSGYPRIRVDKKLMLMHRYIYEKYYGKILRGYCVCHRCDNPLCINPKHLFAGTIVDNNRDMYQKGRQARRTPAEIDRFREMARTLPPRRGSTNGNSRLTEAQVIEIRQKGRYKPLKHIAADYGVDRKLIYLILRREVWKHV